jgi:hypothetical protein
MRRLIEGPEEVARMLNIDARNPNAITAENFLDRADSEFSSPREELRQIAVEILLSAMLIDAGHAFLEHAEEAFG